MIVVDSSVWIANLRDERRPAVAFLKALARPSSLIIGDIVLLEVLRGARDDVHARELEGRLHAFRIEPMLSARLAVSVARNYRVLRRLGMTISKIPDLLIATYCIEHDHALLHDDRDYVPFADRLGLRVIDVGRQSRRL